MAVSFINRLYIQLNLELTLKDFYILPTVEGVARCIQSIGVNNYIENSNIAIHFNAKNKNTMFAFPPGAAHGMSYAGLSNFIDFCSIYAFDFVEEDSRIDKYIKAIREIQQDGPYTLLGYSAGGNLAFEVAKVLIKSGCEVTDIIMLDSARRENRQENLIDEQFLLNYKEEIKGILGDNEKAIQRAMKKMISYNKYLAELNNCGNINSNIHVIVSEDKRPEEEMAGLKKKWKDASNRNVIVYQGYGSHPEMLDAGYVEKNAGIIKKIWLNRILG